MLLFERPAFKSGLMIVRVSAEGTPYSFALKPSDKGTEVDFGVASAAVLAKYPSFFSIPV